MSEVLFFMNRADTTEFVEWLIADYGCTFVQEWAYELPLPRFASAPDVLATAFGPGHHRRFFLVHADWSPNPLLTQQIHPTSGSRPFHCIRLRYGGPSFDFLASRVDTTDEGVPYVIAGRFDDYPWFYIDPSSPMTYDRPPQMQVIWKAVQSYFRRNGCRTICRERETVGPWVLNHALADYRAGAWLRMGSDHYDPRVRKK